MHDNGQKRSLQFVFRYCEEMNLETLSILSNRSPSLRKKRLVAQSSNLKPLTLDLEIKITVISEDVLTLFNELNK